MHSCFMRKKPATKIFFLTYYILLLVLISSITLFNFIGSSKHLFKCLNICLKSKIANFKVPRKIVFLEELPKGSTGKVQRIGLAKKLGIASK